MNKIILALVVSLACVVPAWATTCAAVASGNWSAQTTWGAAGTGCSGAGGGTGIPGNNDNVTSSFPLTVDVNTTIGSSPNDVIGSTPATATLAIALTRLGTSTTCPTTANGQITVASGVTLTVRGSVSVTGTLYYCSPIITLQPGSTWTVDNSASTGQTAVYRIFGTQINSTTLINAPGTGWGAGQFVTINGKLPSCSGCKQGMWTNEQAGAASGTVKGGLNDTFKHNYNYVKFWYLGDTADAYRSMYFYSSYISNDVLGQQFIATNTEWHNSNGWDTASTSYPNTYMNFTVQYMRTMNSVGANGFLFLRPSSTLPQPGKSWILRYVYLDTGFYQSGATPLELNGFTSPVSYIVADNQHQAYGPLNSLDPRNMPAVDHLLMRQTSVNAQDSTFFGDTSYSLLVVDGGVGNTHCNKTQSFNNNSHSWVIDHAIWQHGDAQNSSDTDPTTQRPGSVTGFPTTWNYMLMLPNAAQPQYTSHATGLYLIVAGSGSVYNHSMLSFGTNYSGVGGINGTYYVGEGDCGVAGTIGFINTIFWNGNPTATESPLTTHTTGCGITNLATTTIVANAIDPTQVHNNVVWNYANSPLPSSRWVAGTAPCGASNCSNYNTVYDYPMTGTVPGANDKYVDPTFVWKTQSISPPGPRDWARIRFGTANDASDTTTEAHFANVFQLFANADPADVTSCAPSLTTPASGCNGLKGRIDDMFAWLYGEWAATNTQLKGAASDALNNGDIGAAPVPLSCPDAPVGADPSKPCKFVSQADSERLYLARLRSLAIVN